MVIISTVIVYFLTFIIACIGMNFIGKKKDSKKRPPHLFKIPIIGSSPFMPSQKTFHIFFMNKSKYFGNIIAFYLRDRYVVVLNGSKTIKEALLGQSSNFADRPLLHISNIFDGDLNGIIQHPYNDNFKKIHRISLNILKSFGFGQRIMESRIKIEVEHLLRSFTLKNGQAFDPKYKITASVANVICSIMFGKRWDIEDPEFQELVSIVLQHVRDVEIMQAIYLFAIHKYLPNCVKVLDDQSILRQRWRQHLQLLIDKIPNMNSENCYYEAFNEQLKTLSENQDENNEQLRSTIKDFMLAGTKTTASTLQWFIILMANNPTVQKRVREEMDQLLGVHKHPSLDDKPNLPIFEASLLEVMRFKTLVPLSVPHSTLWDTYINGMFIPSNTIILPNLYSCHMDPNVWKEPEKFNIDRFLDETKTKVINKEHVVSFSLGKRSCLGELLARQELFLFASALVHEFEICPPIGEEMIDVTEVIALTNSPSDFKARFVTSLDTQIVTCVRIGVPEHLDTGMYMTLKRALITL